MFPFPPFPAPFVGVGLLNRLLRRQAWAQAHLRPHEGKTLRFQLAGQAVAVRIQADGLLRAVSTAAPADVVLTLERDKLGQLAQVLRERNPARAASLMHVEGEAALAQAAMDLAQNLRWDPEDELAAIVGDRAAVRLAGLAKGVAQGLRQASGRLGANVAEYLSEEDPVLLARAPFDDWRGRLGQLQRRLAALDASVAAIEHARSGR